MKKTRRKTIRKALGLIALVLVVAVLAAMPLLAKGNQVQEEYPISILSGKAESRQVALTLSGGGMLTEEDAISITVPTDVKLTEFLVENGDLVKKGDPIARVDRVSVMSAIAATQEAMNATAKKLETASKANTYETLKAPAGVVKAVYAQVGDRAEDVMLAHGALAVVSLDGLMAIRVEAETTLRGGDSVHVLRGGQTLTGKVSSNMQGVLTVTVADKGYEEGESVTLETLDGEYLGEGTLAINSPWKAVAYSGTITRIHVKVGQTLTANASLLYLEDMGYSANYRSLAAQHRKYEEQMKTLFVMYQTLTVTAPADGVISGVDKDSAQLLRGTGKAQLSVLADNTPNGKDDTTYYNFVGQVQQVGTDGWIMRLNPQFLDVQDYANPSVILDPSVMTYEALYTGGAPIYQWDGEAWVDATASEGDLLLFAGDRYGRVVFVVRLGHVDLPDAPDDGEDEGDGSGEGEGGDSDEGEGGNTPGGDQGGNTPGGDSGEGGNTPGGEGQQPGEGEGGEGETPEGTVPEDGTGSQRPGGMGGSMPSFSGYGGGATGSGEEELITTETVEIAAVTPQNTMTLPITIDELDIHHVYVGQTLTVTVDALIGRSFPATVTSIDREAVNNGGSSKFTVTVTMDRAEDMLGGMNAVADIPLSTAEGVSVPVAALSHAEGKTVIYTGKDEDSGKPINPVEVETGASDGEYVIILSGLEEGDTFYYSYYEANDTMPVMPKMG